MKHTPGKWETDKGRLCYCIFARDKNGNRVALATSDDNIIGGAGSSIRMPEKLANARLIAAAPELLEACKEALRVLKYYSSFIPGDVFSQIKNNLEQAIAKAEGKEQYQ